MNKRKFIKFDFDKKNYLFHTTLNVVKELSYRLKSKKALFWLLAGITSYFYSFYLSCCILLFPLCIMLIYLCSELLRALKYYHLFYNSDNSAYGLFYNTESIQLYNGKDYGALINYYEIWMVFDNKYTNSLTLYLKKDISSISIFRNNINGQNFDEFRSIALNKIEYIR